MSSLLEKITITLIREQELHTQTKTNSGPDYCLECSRRLSEWVAWPCLPVRQVEADARVMGRHGAESCGLCSFCEDVHPCPDLLDLAIRRDVEAGS
jgi:hypothetical protein